MNRSFYNGIIGSKAYMGGMDVLANNISNINTSGFKGKEARFSSLFSQLLQESPNAPVSNQIGLGSAATTSIDLSQGSLVSTDRIFDFAIAGDGWFAMQKGSDTYYSRNGAFNIDASSYLADDRGGYLLGAPSNAISTALQKDGAYIASLVSDIPLAKESKPGKIFLPDKAILPAKPTENVTFKGNINPIAADGEIPETANFYMPIIAADGQKASVHMILTPHVPPPSEGSNWDAKVQILKYHEPYDPAKSYDPALYFIDTSNQKVYSILDQKEGSLLFDASGALTENTIPSLSNGNTPLVLNIGTPYNPNIPNSGYDGLTTFSNMPTAGKSVSYDGYEEGVLKGYSAADDGTIYANFTNGKSSAVARIPIYHFVNDQGLKSEEYVRFAETADSGKPFLFTDVDGNVIQGARLRTYALESSNVTLQHALTEMIVMQKAFDANAKSITTSDQMIQKAINMKK